MTSLLAEHDDRGVVLVTGPDATSFLQSLVSQDLDGIEEGHGARSLLLTPQGKLGVPMRMLRVGDEWWLDCDAGHGPELADALERFRIRVDVTVRDRSGSIGILEVRGHDAVARVATTAKVDVPDESCAHVAWGARRVVRSDWPNVAGVDVIGAIDVVREARDELLRAGVQPFPPGSYEVARIEAGVVRLGVDVDDKTIPQEAFLERDAVSFTKGCFLGQELVCRIDTRGHVNRYLRLLRLEAPALSAGAEVLVDDKVVGAVTSSAADPHGGAAVALAMVRRDVVVPATVRVRDGGREVSATVEELPATAA